MTPTWSVVLQLCSDPGQTRVKKFYPVMNFDPVYPGTIDNLNCTASLGGRVIIPEGSSNCTKVSEGRKKVVQCFSSPTGLCGDVHSGYRTAAAVTVAGSDVSETASNNKTLSL